MNHQKFVSIIIATFNGKTKGYLAETIQSVLLQTYTNFELIVVDDGSNDDTFGFVKQNFEDSRILLHRITNCGVSKARNFGIDLAAGEFICILDDDDIWLPQKLEIQLQKFENDENLGMCYCAIERISNDGIHLGFQYHEAKVDFYSQILKANIVDATSGVMIKKEVFLKIGKFSEITQGYEDYELWVRISKSFKIASISDPLLKYRVHSQNTSQNMDKTSKSLFQALELICENDSQLDKNNLYFNAINNLANKSFEIQDYKSFRKLAFELQKYGKKSNMIKIKIILSYFPILIKLLRKIK